MMAGRVNILPSPKKTTVTLSFDEEERALVEKHLGEASYLLSILGSASKLLWHGVTGGFLSGDDAGLHAVLELMSRAVDGAEEREMLAADQVAGRLKMHFGFADRKEKEETE